MAKRNSGSSASGRIDGRRDTGFTLEAAKTTAYRYLARRNHAFQELAQKLARKGFPHGLIQQVMAHLVRLGYVDDARFAREWASSRPHGPLRIRSELRRKGISEALIQDALAMHTEERTLDRAMQLAEQKWGQLSRTDRPLQARRQALNAFLLLRGFSYDTVARVLRQIS